MGQNEVYNLLKKNIGIFLTADQIANGTNTRIQSIYSNLKALEKDSEIEIRKVQGNKQVIKMYKFKQPNDELEQTIHQCKMMKLEERFCDMPTSLILAYISVTEQKKLLKYISQLLDGRKNDAKQV